MPLPAPNDDSHFSPTRRRPTLRLKGYDYAQPGAYFITVCTAARACLLGRIVDGQTILSDIGRMVHCVWTKLSERCPGVAIDVCVIMPNHLHGIVTLTGNGVHHPTAATGSVWEPTPTRDKAYDGGQSRQITLPEVVRRFKTLTTRECQDLLLNPSNHQMERIRLWQRNYYEHVIRDEYALERVRQYIADNPLKWDLDEENPERGA